MNNYDIEITEHAQSDLKALFLYIKNQLLEPAIASKLVTKIENSLFSLGNMPNRYSILETEPFHTNQIRKFQIENHLVFYTVDNERKAVVIIRILYGRRNWQEIV